MRDAHDGAVPCDEAIPRADRPARSRNAEARGRDASELRLERDGGVHELLPGCSVGEDVSSNGHLSSLYRRARPAGRLFVCVALFTFFFLRVLAIVMT